MILGKVVDVDMIYICHFVSRQLVVELIGWLESNLTCVLTSGVCLIPNRLAWMLPLHCFIFRILCCFCCCLVCHYWPANGIDAVPPLDRVVIFLEQFSENWHMIAKKKNTPALNVRGYVYQVRSELIGTGHLHSSRPRVRSRWTWDLYQKKVVHIQIHWTVDQSQQGACVYTVRFDYFAHLSKACVYTRKHKNKKWIIRKVYLTSVPFIGDDGGLDPVKKSMSWWWVHCLVIQKAWLVSALQLTLCLDKSCQSRRFLNGA